MEKSFLNSKLTTLLLTWLLTLGSCQLGGNFSRDIGQATLTEVKDNGNDYYTYTFNVNGKSITRTEPKNLTMWLKFNPSDTIFIDPTNYNINFAATSAYRDSGLSADQFRGISDYAKSGF